MFRRGVFGINILFCIFKLASISSFGGVGPIVAEEPKRFRGAREALKARDSNGKWGTSAEIFMSYHSLH